MAIITGAVVLFGAVATLAMPPIAAIDPAWAIPLNTLLWVILAAMNRRTRRAAESAEQSAHIARKRAGEVLEVVADTRRTVKEAHNATMDAMDHSAQVLAKKYEDSPNPETGRFEPRQEGS